LDSIPGRGSFVSAKQDVAELGRKDRAVALIGELIERLRELRFSYREIQLLVELGVMEREQCFTELAIAVVDCSPEALAIFQRQLNALSHLPIKGILLDDLAGTDDAVKRLANFDLVLTSAKHFTEVLGMAPALKDRIVQMALSPSQATVIALAAIKPQQRVGLVCESRQFREIIQNKLIDLMIDEPAGVFQIGAEADERPRAPRLDDFLDDKDVVVAPPYWQAGAGPDQATAISAFTERGGRIIGFDYQVERGSLMHVEERVRDLLSR
jgi:hypothetical protein